MRDPYDERYFMEAYDVVFSLYSVMMILMVGFIPAWVIIFLVTRLLRTTKSSIRSIRK